MTPSEINDYLERQRPVYLHIARRHYAISDADDMAQEALLEVARRMEKTPGMPDSYYNKVAEYRIIHVIRERRNWTGSQRGNQGGKPVDPLREGVLSMDETFGEGDDLNRYGIFGYEEPGYALAEARHDHSAVREAVATLPEMEQQIARRIAMGLPKSEIAAQLGISETAVNKRWNQKIKPLLRTHLSDHNEEMKAA